MKKVVFYAHHLTLRGTTNAIVDYAQYNQSILGNESTIIYNAHNSTTNPDMSSDINLAYKLAKRFNVISYDAGKDNDFKRLDDIVSKYDVFYFLKAGKPEQPEIKSIKTANHAVFQSNQPHGDRFAYISEWLSTYCSNGTLPYVPHVVNLPPPNMDLRAKLGISKNKFVFGRHGGFKTFDIGFVQTAISSVAALDNYVFLMVNTEKFIDHPNIIYLPSFFGEQEKSNYINACDAMIHGRKLGESFGLSICEFLFHNKPVLAWEGGFDKHHVSLLGDHGLLYNEQNIFMKMCHLKSIVGRDFKQIVDPFTPAKVMAKFDEVFLK